MWLFFLILLALWISIGSFLLYLKSQPVGKKAYRRKVDKRVCQRGEMVKVTLALRPPVAKTMSVDDHDIVLVLDHSASMGSAPGSPLREAVRAMENFVQQFPASCQVGLIVFDHEAQILCNLTRNTAAEQKTEVLRALKTISPGGGTQLHIALDKCVEILNEGRDGVKKTILLLSDGGSHRKSADNSATRVQEQAINTTIFCIGFGAHVDEALMKSVASSAQHYCHVDTAADLVPLFDRLTGVVSGQSAITGLIEEKIRAPRPFNLENTGELYPVGVHHEANQYTQISWFISLLEPSPKGVPLTYTLKPECLGWHTVAPAEAVAHWKMAEGCQDTTSGAIGPKVLVLPNGFAWAWWLLNPLFWLIFGKLFKCVQPTLRQTQTSEEVSPLPTPTLPAPLSIPESHVYIPKLRPALVIGLGSLGEWSLTRLKWQLQDRYIDKAVVDLLVIQDSGVHNRPLVTANGCVLDEGERVILQQDLRPYLETLRHQDKIPDSRYWIPWRQWLRETRPLTSYTDDRRKARLALLLQPEAVAERIKESITRVQEQEGIVLIVASAGDAEGSGMLAEAAHICASHGAGVTAIIVPEMQSSPATAGMVRELERLLILRGESIPSDRGNQTVFAQQLFDRVIVANEVQESTAITSDAISHLLWAMLAYPQVLEQMPSTRKATGYQVKLQGHTLAQRSLWHWVRAMTLSNLINKQWLGVTITDNQITPPVRETDAVPEYVSVFWDNSSLHQRLPTQLLTKSALVLRHGNPLIILEELLDIPLEKPYHEQKVYCERERAAFSVYLEAWCHTILADETEKGQWGLLTLLDAVEHLERDFEKLIESLNKLSGNTALVEQLSFIASIYTDYQVALGGLRASLERWIAVFVGWQPGMQVNPLPQDFVPVCFALEKQLAAKCSPFDNLQQRVKPLYQDWYANYGQNFVQQIRFQVTSELPTRRLVIQLRFFDSLLTHSDRLTDSFREALDRYQEVIFQWPAEDWVAAENVPSPATSLRLGQFSRHAYRDVNQAINEDDPFVIAALSISRPSQLANLFRFEQNSPAIYSWPEEANAARIAHKIRLMLNRQPVPFSAKVVSFLRDATLLHGFMSDLAENRLTIQGLKIMLNRAEQVYEIGVTSPQRPDIKLFEEVVRQVVALGVSLNGQLLPPPSENWVVAPEDAVRMVEQNPLAKAVSESPAWAMWQDVIMGLSLEYSQTH